eukprot:TRINITY_DN990_c0_g1_i3.p1 TRINITY_DN990_c0_g1~~TRINITY_DN990_c0_g1_i3.p1  ORF type:complete len:837 (+),score=145.30 TRINITY_DN990_c0_g1_i3:125-2512(+)
MGMDQRILRPLRTMYRGLKRRFKMPLGVGKSFEVTNGILQGCPISVILINALLSVLFRAIEQRVPQVETQSFADDATLISQVDEASVQQAVDVVAGFCEMTGMALNVKKTIAMGIPKGSSAARRKRPYIGTLGIGDATFPTKKAAPILGAKTCISDKLRERRNNAKLGSCEQLLHRLPSSPLGTRQRGEIVASNVVSRTIHGGSYAPVSDTAMKRHRSKLTTGIIGVKHPSRSVGATLSIINKSHLTDPATANAYTILRTLFDTCSRRPGLVSRLNSIKEKYEDHDTLSPKDALGPVGIALHTALPAAGLDWGDNILDCALGEMNLVQEDRSSRNHALREQLRRHAWRKLAEFRPSFAGIENGVDYLRTNELRLTTKNPMMAHALTVILIGGIFFATRWGRNNAYVSGGERDDASDTLSSPPDPPDEGAATQEECEEDEEAEEYEEEDSGDAASEADDDPDAASPHAENADPPPEKCVHCKDVLDDTPNHLWWECSAFDCVRSEPQFAPLLAADRSDWPPCLARYGVVPEGFDVDVTLLHTLMGRIVLKRWELEAKSRGAKPLVHPWTAALSLPAEPHDFDFSRIPDVPPGERIWKKNDIALLRAFTGWLKALRWTDRGVVSNIELALDFEVYTGMQLPRATEGTSDLPLPPLRERGRVLWTLMKHVMQLCQRTQLGKPWPAERQDRVGCLSSVGAGEVWGGVVPRPIFAGGAETITAIENSAKRAARVQKGDLTWGSDVYPDYTGINRAGRAAAWETPGPGPTRSASPVLVPEHLAMHDKTRVCNAHSKPRCDV